jgi:hypothetical protein
MIPWMLLGAVVPPPEPNIYEPPASSGKTVRPPSSAVRNHLVLAGILTLVAVILCEASLSRIRILLPEYPNWITLGIYTPPELARIFHSVGSTGLAAVFLTACLLAGVNRKIPLPKALLRTGAVLHLAFLSLSTLAYGFSLWQVTRVLAQLRPHP